MRRILTIDGGGIKGVFPASFLATIEDQVGQKIGDYFDLIVGTSTGGIIALGLSLGLSAQEILDFYEKEGPGIFKGNRFLRAIRHLGISKYSQKPLREALEGVFGDHRLGECKTRLVIPSLNLENGEVYVYKTAHHDRFKSDFKEKMVDVALATSAAPTYFPTHKSAVGTPLVDGGLWANNPMGMAVVEAIGVLGWDQKDLRVLSVGCTSEAFSIGAGRRFALGMGYWGLKIVNAFMTAQSFQSLGTAQLLAGHNNVFRYDPVVEPNKFKLDGVKSIPSLKGYGASEARKALPALEEIFFKETAESFVPIHSLDRLLKTAQ